MRNFIYIIIACFLLTGCSKKKTDGPVLEPGKALLVFPEQNALCITGTETSSAQSTVVFKWNNAVNTGSYDLVIKNLLTGLSDTKSVSATEASVSLLKNTPYSWFVVSKSASGNRTTQSESWKFYNSGDGILSYAPFPADGLTPASGQLNALNGKITLNWKGSDTDNDILNYDVYFGTVANPPLLYKGVTEMRLENVFVTSKTKYYWRVLTRDTKGNTSESELAVFSVN